MACAGIDFGNKTSIVAIARRGGIDICVNEVSNRATPTMVSFQGNERHMGEAASSIAAQNFRNTASSLQRLLGVPHADPFAETETKRVTCPVVPDPATGLSAIQVSYTGLDKNNDQDSFSMQAVVAMLLNNLMTTASNEYKAPVRDLVISVPVYYTESQRRALLDAAAIANVNVLRVMNEHAATALSYGIFRTRELPDTTPIKVAFVDIGEASTTVSISSFTNTRCNVLSVASDPSLGGRNLDDIIVSKFAAEFKDKYGIDVLSKPKPAARLRKECEKVKKILSANAEAPINIECLMNDVDVRGHIKRDELETIAAPLFERIRKVCETAIADANLSDGESLTAVEVVGGSTRVPAFKTVVMEVFAKHGAPLRTTLNADECIARGCALMSAMLSPAFKVRDYIVSDINIVTLDAEKIFTDGTPNEVFTLVPKKNAVPCLKALTFRSPGPLTLNVRYKDPSSLPICKDQTHLCGYLLDTPLDADTKVRAKIRLTANGTVELASATLLKEVEEEELVEVKKEEKPNGSAAANTTPAPPNAAAAETAPSSAPPDGTNAPKQGTDQAANGTGSADTPMTESEETDAQMSDAPASSDGSANKDAPAETATKLGKDTDKAKEGAKGTATSKETAPVYETRIVKKTKQTEIKVTAIPGIGYPMTSEMVVAATEKEANMRANDQYIKDRSEAMNSLEAYVYDLRSRIDEYGGDLKEYGPSEVRTTLKTELDATEEWIYSEEADAASKSAFIEKKNQLHEKAEPMIIRKREFEERPVRINVLDASIQAYKQVCVPGAEEYAHISDEDKEKVLKCVEGAAVWLKQEAGKQDALAKNVDPVLTCKALTDKLSEIDALCKPIKNTPKPKEEEKKPEAKPEDAAAASEGEMKPAQENGNSSTEANGDPMEVEKEGPPTGTPVEEEKKY